MSWDWTPVDPAHLSLSRPPVTDPRYPEKEGKKKVLLKKYNSRSFHPYISRSSFSHRSVNFRVLPVLIFQLLDSLLLLLSLLLVQTLQVLPPLVFFQHLVALKLLVTLRIVILKIFSGLTNKHKKKCMTLHFIYFFRFVWFYYLFFNYVFVFLCNIVEFSHVVNGSVICALFILSSKN